MKWLDNIKSKTKPKATDDNATGVANDSQQNKDYQKIASKKYKKELRKSPYKLISNLKIQDVKPSVLRSQLHNLASDADNAGALRQVKQGYLVILISEQNLIDAGYSATNRESKQRYGQFTAALQKRKLRSATLLGDKLNGYVAIVPDNYKDNDEGITSLQLLLSYVNFNNVGLHWGLFKNDYDDNSLNNTNEVLDTTVTLDQLKQYSEDHTPLHIEGKDVVEGPDTSVDNTVSQGEADTNKATNPSSNAITQNNTLDKNQKNPDLTAMADNNPDLTSGNRPDLTGGGSDENTNNTEDSNTNTNKTAITGDNQRQNSDDLLGHYDESHNTNQNNDADEPDFPDDNQDDYDNNNQDDYDNNTRQQDADDLGLNGNPETDEDAQFEQALSDTQPKTRVEGHQDDNEDLEPSESNDEFANRLSQFDENTFYDNDLDLQIDLNPLKNMLLVHQPKHFALKPIDDDNQKLDKLLNRQRQQANDKLTEMVNQSCQTIYNNAYNELQRAITNAEQQYSLVDSNTKFGNYQKQIEDTYNKQRKDLKLKLVVQNQELDANYQKLLDKKASLAAEQARLDYDELHKDDLQRQKDTLAAKARQQIDDDQIKFSNELKTKRNNDANVYVHQLMTVIMEKAQEQLNILDASVDKVYTLEQQTMTNIMSNNYKDEVSRQRAVAEEIKHDNTIDRLHQDIKRLNQDNADKIKDIQADCDDKIASIRASSEQVLHQHEQQYSDDIEQLHQQLKQVKDRYAQDMKLSTDSLNEKDDELSRLRDMYDAKLEKASREKDIVLDKFTRLQQNDKHWSLIRTGITSTITFCAGLVLMAGFNMLSGNNKTSNTNQQPTTSIIQIPSQNQSSSSSSSSENVPTSNSSSESIKKSDDNSKSNSDSSSSTKKKKQTTNTNETTNTDNSNTNNSDATTDNSTDNTNN